MGTWSENRGVDVKIHKFMARKSQWKMLSRDVANRLVPSVSFKADASQEEISFEPIEWKDQGGTKFRATLTSRVHRR